MPPITTLNDQERRAIAEMLETGQDFETCADLYLDPREAAALWLKLTGTELDTD